MTLQAALAMLLAAGFGGFAWLALAMLSGYSPLPYRAGLGNGRWRRRLSGPGGVRLAAAVGAGAFVLLLTRWVPLAAAAGAMVLAWPKMFGAARQQQALISRLEALATWIEALRDTIATGLALPEAIPVTTTTAPAVLQRPLQDLLARMQAREPLDRALLALADELDDAVSDQAIAALALNARAQGRQLKSVLTALAEATRRQVDVRREVEAQRRSTRQGVRIIMVVTALFVTGLAVFNRGYVAPFSTVVGQFVLTVAIGCFAAGFAWMHRLSSFQAPARFLAGTQHDRPGSTVGGVAGSGARPLAGAPGSGGSGARP